MKIVHFTSDLMLGSQVSQAARPRGIDVEMVNSLDRLFERTDEAATLVILDLQSANWSAGDFQRLRADRSLTVRCVAYAQHVLPELLDQAKLAGIETVMTRGQFAASIPRLLEELSSIDA